MKTVAALLAIAMFGAGCSGNDSKTTTAPAATTASVAPPTTVETFAGSVAAAGSVFYSFVVSQNGTVNVTLDSITGTDLPAGVALGVGIGTPSGTGCGNVGPTTVLPGLDPQVTGTYAAGRYCVQVSDVGNVVTAAAFEVTIAHP